MENRSFSGQLCLGLIALLFNNYAVNAIETLQDKMKNDPDISQVTQHRMIVVKVAVF